MSGLGPGVRVSVTGCGPRVLGSVCQRVECLSAAFQTFPVLQVLVVPWRDCLRAVEQTPAARRNHRRTVTVSWGERVQMERLR